MKSKKYTENIPFSTSDHYKFCLVLSKFKNAFLVFCPYNQQTIMITTTIYHKVFLAFLSAFTNIVLPGLAYNEKLQFCTNLDT